MKKNKKVRKAVFETNSSSSHSLHIDDSVDVFETLPINSGYIDELEEVRQNVAIIRGGEFGWSWEKFKDAQTKASYLATMLINLKELVESSQGKSGDDVSIYGLTRFAIKNYLECLKNFEDAIKEQTGALEVVILGDEDSYIDHQSFESENDATILFDKEKIRNFIFNPKSILYTGNDNTGAPLNFYCNDNEAKFHIKVEGFGMIGNLRTQDKKEIGEVVSSILDEVECDEDEELWGCDVDLEKRIVTCNKGWGNNKEKAIFKYTIENV